MAEETTEATQETPTTQETPVAPKSPQDFLNEFESTGTFTPESLAQMQDQFNMPGLTAEMAGQFAQGQVALRNQMNSSIEGVVGGDMDAFQTIVGEKATQAEKDAFDQAYAAGNVAVARSLAAGLAQTYGVIQETPAAPAAQEAPSGGPASSFFRPSESQQKAAATEVSAGVFQSSKDYLDSFADPRYRTDAAYRTQVEARMAASMNAGAFADGQPVAQAVVQGQGGQTLVTGTDIDPNRK